MKCMCAQTRPRFILSSEGVLGMEFEPMLTPMEKSPLPENVPRGVSNPRHFGSEPMHYQLSYSSPRMTAIIVGIWGERQRQEGQWEERERETRGREGEGGGGGRGERERERERERENFLAIWIEIKQ